MPFIYPLCSSSKGNCTYVGTREQGILVDAGIGIRNFATHLALIDVKKSAIQGIFITHEHSDHIKGLARIQAALQVPVYASAGTLRALSQKALLDEHVPVEQISEGSVTLGGMCVTAFSTPHDSAESQDYVIEMADGKRAAVCTDLGHVPEQVHAHLKTCDLVMLESNYEASLLQIGVYPWFLKKRIAGQQGHLSNDDCTAEITRLLDANVRHFVLGHLSEENNRPELAFASVVSALSCTGAVLDQDFQLKVAPKTNTGQLIEIV